MTREETKAILSVLKAAYPYFYKDKDKQELTDALNLWSMMFVDESAKLVTEAVKTLLNTLKFPPTIADVKEKIALITQPKAITELEAWVMVRKAIGDYSPYDLERNAKTFNSLPSSVQKIIGSSSQLREWGQMDIEVVQSVVQSNFMRSYKSKVASEKELSMLPESTKLMIGELSQKMGLLHE